MTTRFDLHETVREDGQGARRTNSEVAGYCTDSKIFTQSSELSRY